MAKHIFIAYADEDKSLVAKLRDLLIPLEREGPVWSNDDEIHHLGARKYLSTADIILLMVSPDFLDSDYCYSREMAQALERHRRGEAHVIPVLLRPVYWAKTPFSRLEPIPRDSKFVTEEDDHDTALQKIVDELQRFVLPHIVIISSTGLYSDESILSDERRIQALSNIVSRNANRYETQKLYSSPIQKSSKMLEARKKDTTIPSHQPTEPLTTNQPIYTSKVVSITQRVRELSLLKRTLLAVLALFLIVSGVGSCISIVGNVSHPVATVTAVTHNEATPTIKDGIGVKLVDEEYIGISDGQYALDTSRRIQDVVTLMQKASESFRNGNTDDAQKKWQEAHEKDTRYAEPLIYAENQRVKDSHRPYITIVLGVSLSDKGDGFSRDVLQAAYIAQKECNENPQLSGGKMLRLLIAKSGIHQERSRDIAQQIVLAAQSDKSIVGVQGWTTSQMTLNVIKIFEDAGLPILASDTASDELTNISPYFFRISLPSSLNASLTATYIEKKLASQLLVILRDPSETYSRSLSDSLIGQFGKDGYDGFHIENFQTADEAVLIQHIENIFNRYNPDLIYIATNNVNDVRTLLRHIPSTQQYANLKVWAGGAGYELVQAGVGLSDYTRMILSSSAYPDEWSLLVKGYPTKHYPERPFFKDYPLAYDPHNQHINSPYTYRRADSEVMIDYDALCVFLEASRIAINSGKQNLIPEDIKNALSQIKGSQTFQGITGAIEFGSDGNPVNKAHFVLRVVNGNLKVVAYQGCFLVGSLCDNENIQYWPP